MKFFSYFKKLQYFIVIALVTIFFTSIATSSETNKKNINDKKVKKDKIQKIVSKKIKYKAGKVTLIGHIFYDENSSTKKPGIIVIHEWWGNNDYSKTRAKMLAELGYVAFAADMYGNGLVVDNPNDAQKEASLIYSNPTILKERFNAAYETLIKNNLVDSKHIAAIGYCFGGTVVLNAANMGIPLDAVVVFHGGLKGFKADSVINKSHILVCNGAEDKFVTSEDITNFKKSMDKVGANYEFINYKGATHAFTNPSSTETGKKYNMPIAYNEKADIDSWNDMQKFFAKYFPTK